MSTLRKIVKVEPVPRAVPMLASECAFLLFTGSKTVADDIINYDSFTVTYSCGHTDRWLNRPKREEYDCNQCE